MVDATQLLRGLESNLGKVILGQPTAIRWLIASFAAGGHVLLEDMPGTGKTTLANALARSIAANFKRVQFTADLLPSDIIGVSTFDPREIETVARTRSMWQNTINWTQHSHSTRMPQKGENYASSMLRRSGDHPREKLMPQRDIQES